MQPASRVRVVALAWCSTIAGVAQAEPGVATLRVGLARCARQVRENDFASCYHTAREITSTREGVRSPDAVLILAVCSEVSAQDIDDIDVRVGRMADAYLTYEQYLRREQRPQFRARRNAVPAHMVALKARIAQLDHSEASILLDPPGAPSNPLLAAAGMHLVVHDPEPRTIPFAEHIVSSDEGDVGMVPLPATVKRPPLRPPATSMGSDASASHSVAAEDPRGSVADQLLCFIREGMVKRELIEEKGGRWVERTTFPHLSTSCPAQ